MLYLQQFVYILKFKVCSKGLPWPPSLGQAKCPSLFITRIFETFCDIHQAQCGVSTSILHSEKHCSPFPPLLSAPTPWPAQTSASLPYHHFPLPHHVHLAMASAFYHSLENKILSWFRCIPFFPPTTSRCQLLGQFFLPCVPWITCHVLCMQVEHEF